MQCPQNSTKHDVSSIATKKYTTSKKKHNMAKFTINILIAQYNNYIPVWPVNQSQTNRK